MPVPALPVPELEATLRRFLATAAPLLDEPELERTREQAEDFARGEGPELQAALEAFARAEDDEGRSWLSQEWLRGYLSTREPLPLATSVGFQIADAGDHGEPGADRAAQLIHRAAAVHLQELRGHTPQELDARGHRMSMEQWGALRGGIRHPRPDTDEIRRPRIDAEAAEIGILHRGRLHALRIADEHGQPLPPGAVAAAVRRILSRPSAWTDAELPFGAASAPGGQSAARLLAELTDDEHNQALYDRLTRMVFLVHLTEDLVDESEHLRRLAFEPGRTWHRKPLTYEVGLRDQWMGVHVEHSTIDGATLLSALARMQELELPDERTVPVESAIPDELPRADTPAAPGTGTGTGDALPVSAPEHEHEHEPEPEAVQWRLAPVLRRRLVEALAQQREAAAPYETRIVVVDRPDPAEAPFRVSDDAAQQLILTCAQLAAFGRARSVYEAVDLREYRAGRTECLRPVTSQAVDCAEALLTGRATPEQVRAALDAHRDWVKACKAGRGIDRHLLGLQLMAERAQRDPVLLVSAARTAIGEDFLSTTSIGGAGQIVRYAFAPSTPEGFGVTYTRHERSYEFCLSSRRDTREDQDAFAAGLHAGAEALGAALRSFG